MADERFDIYDEHLTPIGTATRAETHAKGYWHRSFHCWLTRREGNRRFVRFQLRQAGKDTNPNCFDITAAGHLSAGETMRDAVRELEEELGIKAEFEQLIPLGQIREQCIGEVNGVPFIDREVSDVFGFVCDLPLTEMKLQPEEVAAVFEADLDELIALFEGALDEVHVEGVSLSVESDGLVQVQRVVHANQFVPREHAHYSSVLRALLGCS